MASNKTALNHGIIFRDPRSGDMSITFERKSQKAGNREILISADDNRVPSSGEVHGILMEFLTEEGGNRGTDPSDRFPVFLGGFFMWRGVKIEKKDLHLLRLALKRSKLDPDFKESFEKALDHYKSDGRRWDFDSNELSKIPSLRSNRKLLTVAQPRIPTRLRK